MDKIDFPISHFYYNLKIMRKSFTKIRHFVFCLIAAMIFVSSPSLSEEKTHNNAHEKPKKLYYLPQVLPIREQVRITTRILQKRLDTVLPVAMRSAGIDMWLVICQEDNLDPIYKTMIPMDTSSKVLHILVFFDKGNEGGIERINLSMSNTGNMYKKPWKGGNLPQQWQMLAEIIAKRDPQHIGINIGSINWAAGGLTQNLYTQLLKILPEKYKGRLMSAEKACTKWGMTLTQDELAFYPQISAITRDIISRCFSSASITPGVTTCNDLDWLFWQICSKNGLELSFKPYFCLRRSPAEVKEHPLGDGIIHYGDIIICDVGIRYLGLYTDYQEIAYIRHPKEADAPHGLKKLLAENNRLQEIFMREFKPGMSGNQVLLNIFDKAKAEGISTPYIYSHSIGLFVHEPGPVIGYPWEQKPVPGRGELLLDFNSCYAMELGVLGNVEEWDNHQVYLPTEQIVVFTEKGCKPIDQLQKTFHLR